MSGAIISATMSSRRKAAQISKESEQTRSLPKPPSGRFSHFGDSMKQNDISNVLNEPHLLKVENNQVYMLNKREVVKRLAGLLERPAKRCVRVTAIVYFFFIFVVLYLSVMSFQWNTVEMHDQYRAIRNEILAPLMGSDGYIVDTVANADFIVDDWLDASLNPIFKDTSCGDANVIDIVEYQRYIFNISFG